MVEISRTPDSKIPFYIEPSEMEFCFFVAHYEDGDSLSQYEQTEDGEYIAHHWTEVALDRVRTLEAWGFKLDQGVALIECLKSITIPDNRVPFFRYRVVKHPHLNIQSRKAVVGYKGMIGSHSQELWGIDANYNMRQMEAEWP